MKNSKKALCGESKSGFFGVFNSAGYFYLFLSSSFFILLCRFPNSIKTIELINTTKRKMVISAPVTVIMKFLQSKFDFELPIPLIILEIRPKV